MTKIDPQLAPRKTIVPWYDSKAVCIVVMVVMFFVFVFGYIGLSLARETAICDGCLWVPILLMFASGIIIVLTTIRLIRRHLAQRLPPYKKP